MSDMSAKNRNWVQKKDYFFLILVLVLLPLMALAGGLGIAAITAIAGGAALIDKTPKHIGAQLRRTPFAIWLIFALLLWGLVSSLWSPYQPGGFLTNPVKLLIGFLAFIACAAMIKQQAGFEHKTAFWLLIIGMFGAALVVLYEFASGYVVSLSVDPPKPGRDINLKHGDIIQNLGHGVTVLSLMLPVVFGLLWPRGIKSCLCGFAFAALIIACGFVSGVSAALMASICALAFMGLAAYWPRIVLAAGMVFAALSLLLAPVLGYIATILSDKTKALLPFSWHERVDNWAYLYEKVGEHPLTGHGFDAVRTFNETQTIRGFEGRAIISLHPHNAGLHIWVELGFVGIAIACAALFYGGLWLLAPGRLGKMQMIATTGLVVSAAIISSLSYGVWQDWWWASIILSAGLIFLVKMDFDN